MKTLFLITKKYLFYQFIDFNIFKLQMKYKFILYFPFRKHYFVNNNMNMQIQYTNIYVCILVYSCKEIVEVFFAAAPQPERKETKKEKKLDK